MTSTTTFAEPSPPYDTNDATNEARPYYTNHKTATELGWQQPRKRDPLLDRPSERVPLLDRLFDHALAQILLTADGSTTSFAAKVHGGDGGQSRAPVSGLAAELEELAGRYVSCSTHRARLVVIAEAQAWGYRLRIAPAPDPTRVRGSREWRERVANYDGSCRQTAERFRVSLRDVVAFRKEFRVKHSTEGKS